MTTHLLHQLVQLFEKHLENQWMKLTHSPPNGNELITVWLGVWVNKDLSKLPKNETKLPKFFWDHKSAAVCNIEITRYLNKWRYVAVKNFSMHMRGAILHGDATPLVAITSILYITV